MKKISERNQIETKKREGEELIGDIKKIISERKK